MTKVEFSAKILKVSYGMWRFVLRGERNLSYKKALLASQVLSTPVDVWLDAGRVREREDAWAKFIQ